MKIVDLSTNTSKWSLVLHKVTQDSILIWVGTLFDGFAKPDLARIIVSENGNELIRHDISRLTWAKPFENLNQRFYHTQMVTDLQAATSYQVAFYRRLEGDEHLGKDHWQLLRKGHFTTLPAALPTQKTKPFTVSLGSCYYEHGDNGQAARTFKRLYENASAAYQPNIKFMTGDQVYLDIGLDSLSPNPKEVPQRIAQDYAKHWQALGSMLSRGGTWMLPDDHEYWNDYPFYDSLIPTLFMLKIKGIRNAWERTAKYGVQNVQQSKKVDCFSIGNDLSFCIADLRSYRSKTQFIDKQGFQQLTDWAKGLTCPGVLVIPQILMAKENKCERNLLSFKGQYAKLVTALASTGNDIVVLSGDVHFGRIAQVKLGDKGGNLIEVVSSPMSNLTGYNSLATAVASAPPKHFPNPEVISVPELTPQKVKYDKIHRVSDKGRSIFSSYWKRRTREHLMTISFHKEGSKVKMSVQAWRIRELDRNKLPIKDLKQRFEATLSKGSRAC